MSVTVEQGDFQGREDARSQIEARGLFARDGAMASGDLEDVHWHVTSLRIYVLTGQFETRDVKADTTLMAGPGDIITIRRQTLHAARCPEPATYVVGFESEDAAKRFRPESPDALPARTE